MGEDRMESCQMSPMADGGGGARVGADTLF